MNHNVRSIQRKYCLFDLSSLTADFISGHSRAAESGLVKLQGCITGVFRWLTLADALEQNVSEVYVNRFSIACLWRTNGSSSLCVFGRDLTV